MLAGLLLLVQAQELPAYSVAIRCAALAEAADVLETDEANSRPLYDAAMFWGLAASERARKDGLSAATFTADQEKARGVALEELKAGKAGVVAEVVECVMKVPNSKG